LPSQLEEHGLSFPVLLLALRAPAEKGGDDAFVFGKEDVVEFTILCHLHAKVVVEVLQLVAFAAFLTDIDFEDIVAGLETLVDFLEPVDVLAVGEFAVLVGGDEGGEPLFALEGLYLAELFALVVEGVVEVLNFALEVVLGFGEVIVAELQLLVVLLDVGLFVLEGFILLVHLGERFREVSDLPFVVVLHVLRLPFELLVGVVDLLDLLQGLPVLQLRVVAR
jgi:hypothetical protein